MSSTNAVTIAQAESSNSSGLTVADTAANIAQGLASFPGLAARVSSFNLTAPGTVTAGMAALLGGLGGKLHLGGQALTVQDTLANVTAAGNAAGVALASGVVVMDAAFNLLNAASTRFAHVTSVVLTGSPILTAAQLTKLEALPHFSIASGSAVTLSDTVSAVSAALSAHAGWFTPLTTISIHLDGSTIGAYTAGLLNAMMSNGKHVSFVPSATDATLNITAALHDIAANAAPLNGLAAHVALAFHVTNPAASVTAADLVNLLALPAFAPLVPTLNVADTAAALDANIKALYAQPLAGITVTSGAFSASAPQLVSPLLHFQGNSTAILGSSATGSAAAIDQLTVLPKFSLASGVVLTMQDSYANIIAAANSSAYAVANRFLIRDTGANLATAAAHNWGTAPQVYVLIASGAVNAAQLAVLSAPNFTFINQGYYLTLADTVSAVLGLSKQAIGNAAAIAISDVSTNVTTTALNLLENSVNVPLTIMLTDTGHVRVTAAAYIADLSVIDDITYASSTPTGTGTGTGTSNAGLIQPIANHGPLIGAGAVIVTGNTQAILNIADQVNTDPHVASVAITDTTEVMNDSYFDTLSDELAVPVTITLTDPDDTVSVLSSTYANDTAQVDAIQNATDLEVTGAAADLAPLAATLAADYRITQVVLTDTATNIDAQAATLMPMADKLSIVTTAGGTVGPATLALLAICNSFELTGSLTLSTNVAGVTGLSSDALDFATNVVITDVSTSLTSAALDTLESSVAKILTSITLTDTGTVGIGVLTYFTDLEVIDKITNSGAVTVTDSTAALNATETITGGSSNSSSTVLSMLEADPVVGSIVANDTAANIVADIGVLLNVGPKLSVSLTDTTPIAVGLVPQLALLPVTNAAKLVVADSGANIAAVVEAATVTTANFLTAASVKLNANSVVLAADAKALVGLSSFSNAGYTLSVWDTAAHLTSGLYTATFANSDVSALYLQTNGVPVTLSAATMISLLSLPHFHTTSPTGVADSITVSDTAAHLAALLTTYGSQLSHVGFVVNANATVNTAVLAQLQTAGATAAAGVTLTLRDTAANIAAEIQKEAAAIITPSILPAALTLSGSSGVSLGNAELLGARLNFSAGPYTLSVVQTTDVLLSIANAAALGHLGASLVITGGGHLTVAGNISQLSALPAPLFAIVSPVVTDSLSNVIGLSASSPLLGGTLTVSDAESMTTLQAGEFFGLLKTSSGSGSMTVTTAGIAPANVSFGANVEQVTDSIAALQSLTTSTGWLQGGTLTAAFSLTAMDSVANLIAAGNTGFLAGLAGTELSFGATTDAASAERLFGLEKTIHFTAAGSALRVQDTAANLLNPNNADGLGLASTISLSADDTTTAAGAETLLGNAKFGLTHVLTIADTPADLLDGTLATLLRAGDFGGDIQVELSAPTVTDASTAEALVSLPGFIDPAQDLSISDHPNFLIDPTYLPAETLATTVTIPGDELVSAATILRLSQVPHFTPGDSHLILAANDVVDDPTLAAIGDLGTSYLPNGHTITMTQDDTALTQTEFNALQNDNVVTNGHLFSVAAPPPALTVISLQDNAFMGLAQLILSTSTQSYGGTGYDASGRTIATDPGTTATGHDLIDFANAAQNFSFTEPLNGSVSNPVILLDTATLTAAANGAAFSTVATPGALAFSIGAQNDYLPIYTAGSGSAPQPNDTALVFNPLAQTLSLQANEHSTVLITLGGTSHPASLVAAEFFVKTFQA